MDVRKDPIGAELILAILSFGVSSIAAIHQFGWLKGQKAEFRRIRELVLSAQDELDDLILLLERYALDPPDDQPVLKNMTLLGTVMALKERDYHHFNRIREKIHELSSALATVVSALRSAEVEFGEPTHLLRESELFAVFDELLALMSDSTCVDFIDQLRTALDKLSGRLSVLS